MLARLPVVAPGEQRSDDLRGSPTQIADAGGRSGPGDDEHVDRLTFGGNIIETGTESFRLAQTLARSGDTTTESSAP